MLRAAAKTALLLYLYLVPEQRYTRQRNLEVSARAGAFFPRVCFFPAFPSDSFFRLQMCLGIWEATERMHLRAVSRKQGPVGRFVFCFPGWMIWPVLGDCLSWILGPTVPTTRRARPGFSQEPRLLCSSSPQRRSCKWHVTCLWSPRFLCALVIILSTRPPTEPLGGTGVGGRNQLAGLSSASARFVDLPKLGAQTNHLVSGHLILRGGTALLISNPRGQI